MRVLGIETATEVCGAALVENGRVLAENWFEARQMHSEKLVSLIAETLQSRGHDPAALDAIAISIGPGSFSGLRIGLSVAKGLAFACDLQLVAVPTLRALATRALAGNLVTRHERVLPLIDARRDEVYTALYEYNGENLVEIASAHAASVHELVGIGPDDNRPIVVMGDGAEKFKAYLSSLFDSGITRRQFRIPVREKRLCDAASVALEGEQMFRRGDIADSAGLEPLYVKEFYTTMKPQSTEVRG